MYWALPSSYVNFFIVSYPTAAPSFVAWSQSPRRVCPPYRAFVLRCQRFFHKKRDWQNGAGPVGPASMPYPSTRLRPKAITWAALISPSAMNDRYLPLLTLRNQLRNLPCIPRSPHLP